MNSNFTTREDAAKQLGVHPATILRWLKSGVLEGRQIVPNGSWYISRASVEQLAAKINATK